MAQIKIPDLDAVKIKDIGIINATGTKTIAQQIHNAMYSYDSGESQKEYANGYVILFQTESYVDSETKLIARGLHQAFPYGDGGFLILDGGKFYELSGQRATLIEVDNYKKRGRELNYEHSIYLASQTAAEGNTPPQNSDLFFFRDLNGGQKVYVIFGVGGSYGKYCKGNHLRRNNVFRYPKFKYHNKENDLRSYQKMDTKYRYHSLLGSKEGELNSIIVPESGWITWQQILNLIFTEGLITVDNTKCGYEAGNIDDVYYVGKTGLGKNKNHVVVNGTTFQFFDKHNPSYFECWFKDVNIMQSIRENREINNGNSPIMFNLTKINNQTSTTNEKKNTTNLFHIYLKFSLDAQYKNGTNNANGWNGTMLYQGIDLAIRFHKTNGLEIIAGIYNV